jgi:hypothetical protein
MIIVYAAIPATVVLIGGIALYMYIKGNAAAELAKGKDPGKVLSVRSSGDPET